MPLTAPQKKALTQSFLFAGTQADCAGFFETLSVSCFAAGEEIYSAHSFSRAIGLLTSGVAVVRGQPGVILNTLGAGDCFGVAALFHPVEEYVTTVLAKRTCEVIFITDTQLTGLFAADPKTAINYIAFLSRRIDFLNRKIDSFTAPSARDALCLFLLKQERDGVVELPQGFAQLARSLNIGRASLYRGLEALEREGVIERGEKRIRVLNPGALRPNENRHIEGGTIQ